MKIKARTSPAFLLAYQASLAKLKAQQSAPLPRLKTMEEIKAEGVKVSIVLPTPPAAPEVHPPHFIKVIDGHKDGTETEHWVHPLCHRAMLGIKLAGKSKWFVALRGNYFLVVRECGKPFQMTRHILECYKLESMTGSVNDILEANKPFFTSLSKPFLFHSETEAVKMIEAVLPEIAESAPL